jgi:hypothetical protein
MNLRKAFTGLIASAALCAAVIGPASAQLTNFAGVTGIGDTVFTYTSGVGFSVTPGADFIAQDILPPVQVDVPATLSFTGVNDVDNVINRGGGLYEQRLDGGGGSFLLTRDADGVTLLSGTFSGASLFGTVGAVTGSMRTVFDNVVYTGGVYFASSGLMPTPGSFSFALNVVNPAFGLNEAGTKFNSFTAGGTGIFAAAPAAVPEPGVVAFAAVNGLGVLGLMVRARRRGKLSA